MKFSNHAISCALAFACTLLSASSPARAEDDEREYGRVLGPYAEQPTDQTQQASLSGVTVTVPLTSSAIVPAEYNGDVRDLPPEYARNYYHTWNEVEPPMPQRPPPVQGTESPVSPPIKFAPMPAPLQNFAGLAFNSTVAGGTAGAGWPPDTNGDVGPVYYIQAVNDAYGIFNKSTGAVVASFTENQLWSGAGTGTFCDANNQGDPVAIHDALADRWILSNFAFTSSTTGPFYQCLAVSKTNDPVAGGWYLYAVRTDVGGTGAPPNNTFADYPKFGLWTDCLYMGANGFTNGATYGGSVFAAFDRTALYAGTPLSATNSSIGFNSDNTVFGLFPANLLGTSAASLPPSGTPEYFVDESATAFAFDVRKFHSGATSCGAGSTLSTATSVTQASYGYPANVAGSTTDIVSQPGTTNKVDSLGDELMQRVVYRKIGSAESIWVVHTTCGTAQSANGTCSSNTTSRTQPQWAQIDVSGGVINTTPVQQQIYAPDTNLFRWMGSVAVDGQGNMAIGYSTSNGTSPNFPSLAYSGRLVTDPPNQLPETEVQLVAGGGSQTNNCGGSACKRWGDYSAMTIDPVDDCTFWYTNEYYDTTAHGTAGTWQTRIGSFKFPGCVASLQDQTITFTSSAPTAATVGGATYTPTATATSGLTVTLTIDAAASAVCSISGGVVSFTGTGNCVIDADQAGNASFNAAPQVQQTFTVGKASQTVSFTSTAPTTATVGGATYTPTATATSGLTVALTVDGTASSVCSISGGVVSFTGTGNCVIDANQAGNGSYNAAPQVQQTFAVGKASQTISFTSTAPTTATVGGATYTPTATATSGLTVALTIDATASAVCSISGGVVSFIATGSCVIDANQAGNGNFNAAPQVQQTFTVGKASQTVSFTSTAPTTATVGGATYSPTATATSGLTVTLTIDATASSVCSISGGVVSFTGTGNCVIDANQSGNSNFNAAPQVQQTFAVGKASQTISFTSTAPTTATVGGATYTPTATATSGLTVALTIDATASAVCSISGGVVSFIATGNCVIDANQAGNGSYNAAPQVQQTFAVGKASQTVSFTSTAPTTATVGGATYTPTATATSGLTVTLTIDATASSVCSISGGVVSFTGTGNCVIDANQSGNSNFNAAPQVQQTFAVGKASQTISFTSTAPTTATVGGATYTPTATATSGLTVALTIDGTASSVCSISGGVVSFTGAGSCVIDANQAGNGSYNAAPQVQQTFAVGKASQTISFTSTAPTTATVGGATYTPTATATSGLTVALTIDATASAVCSISGGVVSFIATGSCVIDANQAGNGNFNAAPQVQQTFTVGKASQTISFTSTAPTTATVGGATYTPTATATSGLTVALTVDGTASSVCSISGGVVSFTGTGNCVIDANQAGNGSYNAAPQVQQTFAVGKASQTVSFTSTAPTTATVGGATYSPTASATSGLTVALTVDGTASSVCSISGGVVSFTGAGSCVIDANQAGNGSYNAAPQVQQTFAVGKASQTISFTSTAPTTATVGGATYTPTATATSGLTVALTIDATASAVCSISGGVVSFTGTGNCVIDANQSGNSNFNAALQVQQTFAVAPAPATQLVFTIQPTNVSAGNTLNTVAVAEEDALGHVVSDNATVDFTVAACGGSVSIGSATMVNGVATLTTTQRFYVAATNAQVLATAGALSGSSSNFNVVSNADVVFDSGFESCRL